MFEEFQKTNSKKFFNSLKLVLVKKGSSEKKFYISGNISFNPYNKKIINKFIVKLIYTLMFFYKTYNFKIIWEIDILFKNQRQYKWINTPFINEFFNYLFDLANQRKLSEENIFDNFFFNKVADDSLDLLLIFKITEIKKQQV